MQWTTPWPVALTRPTVPPLVGGLPVHAHHGLLADSAHRVHVGVHRPRHDLRVRSHVGGGDVVVWPDIGPQGVDEAPRDALDLRARRGAGIELDAAFGSAKRQAHQRALPGHQRRERLQLVERGLLVVAKPPLVGPEYVRVLDAVALEEAVAAVVHLHGEVDDDLVLRLPEDGRDVLWGLDQLTGAVEVALDHLEEIVAFAHGRLLARRCRGRAMGAASCPPGRGWTEPSSWLKRELQTTEYRDRRGGWRRGARRSCRGCRRAPARSSRSP